MAGFAHEAPFPDYSQVLDEMATTGYTGTELGDWGFLPRRGCARSFTTIARASSRRLRRPKSSWIRLHPSYLVSVSIRGLGVRGWRPGQCGQAVRRAHVACSLQGLLRGCRRASEARSLGLFHCCSQRYLLWPWRRGCRSSIGARRASETELQWLDRRGG